MSTRRLTNILNFPREVPRVRIVRIGSKMPAFDPWRILNDWELQRAFRESAKPTKRIYLMGHLVSGRGHDDPHAGV